MTTITIKVPVTPETEEKEIEVPFYTKDSATFYKVFGGGSWDVVSVTDMEQHYHIGASTHGSALRSTNKESTEAEFTEAYNRVRVKIDALAGIAERATTEA